MLVVALICTREHELSRPCKSVFPRLLCRRKKKRDPVTRGSGTIVPSYVPLWMFRQMRPPGAPRRRDLHVPRSVYNTILLSEMPESRPSAPLSAQARTSRGATRAGHRCLPGLSER